MLIKLNSEKLEAYKKTHKIKPVVNQEEDVVDLEAPLHDNEAGGDDDAGEEEEEIDEEVVWVNENDEGVYQEMMEFLNQDEEDYGDLDIMPALIPQRI